MSTDKLQNLVQSLSLNVLDQDAWNALAREAARHNIEPFKSLREENDELRKTLHMFAFSILDRLKEDLSKSLTHRKHLLSLDKDSLSQAVLEYFDNYYEQDDNDDAWHECHKYYTKTKVDYDYLAEDLLSYCKELNSDVDDVEFIPGFDAVDAFFTPEEIKSFEQEIKSDVDTYKGLKNMISNTSKNKDDRHLLGKDLIIQSERLRVKIREFKEKFLETRSEKELHWLGSYLDINFDSQDFSKYPFISRPKH